MFLESFLTAIFKKQSQHTKAPIFKTNPNLCLWMYFLISFFFVVIYRGLRVPFLNMKEIQHLLYLNMKAFANLLKLLFVLEI